MSSIFILLIVFHYFVPQIRIHDQIFSGITLINRFYTFYVSSVTYCPPLDYLCDQKAHEKGQIHFSYGYGQPRLDAKLFDYQKDSTDFKVVGVGPFFWKAEYGLSRKLSVMLSASYILYKSEWKRMRPDPYYPYDLPFAYGTTLHDISANLRFNYHIFVNKEFDVYIGGGVGYNYFMNKDFTPRPLPLHLDQTPPLQH